MRENFLFSIGRPKRFFCIGVVLMGFMMSITMGKTKIKSENEEHPSIVEKVTVTNIEVPVRVLHKGKPVTNLTKEDFVIFENGEKMEINGFFVKKRKIKIDPTEKKVAEAPILPKRTFVLAFNITNYNICFQKALDHLFEEIFRPSDHIIVFTNGSTLEYKTMDDRNRIKDQVIADIKKESNKARNRLIKYINQLEYFMKDPAVRRDQFLQKYIQVWNEYKRNCLLPRIENFYYFARFLEKLKTEKYVLNFYQFELFPKIRLRMDARFKLRELAINLSNSKDVDDVAMGHRLNTLLNQLESDYDINKGARNEEISKLFYKVDAVFHSFFIRSFNSTLNEDLEYEEVASGVENVLKVITDLTGGKNITSNDLVSSIEKITEVEDVYYILTYAPVNPKIKGKLKIKVKNKKCKVLYDNNFRADYIKDYFQQLEEKVKTPDVKIDDFSINDRIMAFSIKNYLMRVIKEKGDNPVGILKIRIQVKDKDSNSLFDQEKLLTAKKTELSISIPVLKKIKSGNYNFIIDVKDFFTGKSNNLYESVKIK